jgi:hypothetical protein
MKLEVATWISAVANIFIALGVGLAWWSFRGDHERSRREKAIELISQWALNMNKRGSAARKLVETLDREKSKLLFNQEPLKIGKNHIGLVRAALEAKVDETEGDEITLDENQSSELRWQVVTFLNNLESVLSAWRHNIADKEIITEQFRYLVSKAEGHYILEKFRVVAGGSHTYPATQEFVEHIKTEHNKSDKSGKRPVA